MLARTTQCGSIFVVHARASRRDGDPENVRSVTLLALPFAGGCCSGDIGLPTDVATVWSAHLEAAGLAPRSVSNYTHTLSLLTRALEPGACPMCCGTHDIELWLAAERRDHRPSTAVTRHRHLRLFFSWALSSGLRRDDPIRATPVRKAAQAPVPVIPAGAASAILAGIAVDDELDIRDRAILEMFTSTPARLGEITNLRLGDLFGDRVQVLGKGARQRVMPLDRRTQACLADWLDTRAGMRWAKLDWLWITRKGRLTESGIYQVVRRRARQAGVEGMHPHRYRHTFAHRWLLGEGSEGDLMTLAGWNSRQMIDRYGRSAAEERAWVAYRRVAVRADRTVETTVHHCEEHP